MVSSSDELEMRRRGEIHKVFDRISHRYDLANSLLSFFQDKRWRRCLVGEIANRVLWGENSLLLDIATGTGEVVKVFREYSGSCGRVIGIDMSENMLAVARKKIMNCGGQNYFLVMDGMCMGVRDSIADGITMAFGIRNIADVMRALTEIRRVLKPGGVLGILEFGLPRWRVWKGIYLIYLRHLLPLVGKVLTGDIHAYRYLNDTIRSFPSHDKFLELLEKGGFVDCGYKEFLGGVVLLYLARKPQN